MGNIIHPDFQPCPCNYPKRYCGYPHCGIELEDYDPTLDYAPSLQHSVQIHPSNEGRKR